MRLTGPRVVLDTNVLISALIYRGSMNALVPLWQQGKIHLLVSKDVLVEYLRALSYPKFKLSKIDVLSLIEESILPFAETVVVKTTLHAVSTGPEDDKFLALAINGKADAIVSGDKHLLSLDDFRGIPILRAAQFLESGFR